jgi:hypothetical protein
MAEVSAELEIYEACFESTKIPPYNFVARNETSSFIDPI